MFAPSLKQKGRRQVVRSGFHQVLSKQCFGRARFGFEYEYDDLDVLIDLFKAQAL